MKMKMKMISKIIRMLQMMKQEIKTKKIRKQNPQLRIYSPLIILSKSKMVMMKMQKIILPPNNHNLRISRPCSQIMLKNHRPTIMMKMKMIILMKTLDWRHKKQLMVQCNPRRAYLWLLMCRQK